MAKVAIKLAAFGLVDDAYGNFGITLQRGAGKLYDLGTAGCVTGPHGTLNRNG